jgi:CubicO group peptidase (beta-lactamase class C family)
VSITRRQILGAALGGLGAGIAAVRAADAPSPSPAERAAMAAAARAFMEKYAVPGLSVAIARDRRVLYAEAFGLAAERPRAALTPAHRFRIASVTKPITAVTIFALIEQRRLALGDHVFGPGAVLGADYALPPGRRWLTDITLEHLLTHTGGGWPNDDSDPMCANPLMSQRELIAWTLATHALTHVPGTHYAYSNFGYCVLGRVIEKVAGLPYAMQVRDVVLRRCGVSDMEIAGNTLGARKPEEVVYYGQGGEEPYSINVTRMDSHGGWLARPTDLALFAANLDSVLEPATIRTMTTASAANSGYAKGWAVNAARNWWHNGSLPGTSTIAVRTHAGFSWAAFTNTRRPSSNIDGDLDALVWTMVGKVGEWRA